jgi:hypothetical protein
MRSPGVRSSILFAVLSPCNRTLPITQSKTRCARCTLRRSPPPAATTRARARCAGVPVAAAAAGAAAPRRPEPPLAAGQPTGYPRSVPPPRRRRTQRRRGRAAAAPRRTLRRRGAAACGVSCSVRASRQQPPLCCRGENARTLCRRNLHLHQRNSEHARVAAVGYTADAVKVELIQRRAIQLRCRHNKRQRRPRSSRLPVARFQQASRKRLARGGARGARSGHLARKAAHRARDAHLVSQLGRRTQRHLPQPRQLLQTRPVRLGRGQPLSQGPERVDAARLRSRAGALHRKVCAVQPVSHAEQAAPRLQRGGGALRVRARLAPQ